MTKTPDAHEGVMYEAESIYFSDGSLSTVEGQISYNGTRFSMYDEAGEFDPRPNLIATTAPENVTKATAVIGTSITVARVDHKHDVTTAAPGTIGSSLTEVLVDGNMEDPGVGYWTQYLGTATKETVDPHGGTYWLKFTASAGGAILYQSVVTVGKRYRFTGWAKSDGNAAPYIMSGDGQGQLWTGTLSTSWQEAVVDFDCEEYGQLRFMGPNTAGHWVGWDDCSCKLLGGAEGTATSLARSDHTHGSPSGWTPRLHEKNHESGGADEIAHQDLSGAGTNTHAQIDTHIASTANPHSLTATQVSLENVTNDSQLKRAAGDFNSFTSKGTPVAADILLIEDSAASYVKKKVQKSNVPAATNAIGVGNHAGATPFEAWWLAGQARLRQVATTGSAVANTIYAIPFFAPARGGTLDRIAIHNTTTSGSVRLGIYAATSGTNIYPSALTVAGSEITLSGTGVNAATISQALNPGGLYWAVALFSSTPTVYIVDVYSMLPVMGMAEPTSAIYCYALLTASYTYAALPSTFPTGATWSTVNGGTPIAIGYRFSA